jgi:hypothetical protein
VNGESGESGLAAFTVGVGQSKGPLMLEFIKEPAGIVVEYQADFGSNSWAGSELRTHGKVVISKVFHFKTSDLVVPLPTNPADWDKFTYQFQFATLANGYVEIEGRILGISNKVLIFETEIVLARKIFAAVRDTSIFRRIAKLLAPSQDIVIGGSLPGNIPAATYENLLKRFPNSTELDRYAAARVATVLGDHIEPLQDAREQYEKYLNRRASALATAPLSQLALLEAELEKYIFIRDTIAQWLKSSTSRSEKDWQAMIVHFLLLLFPKYVAVLENVTVADYYSSPGKLKHRYIDLALVDAGGNLDVIEVKKPFEGALIGKSRYRGNSVPAKELSGSIMQAEKYLFHLSKWGVEGEKKLTLNNATKLPPGLEIRVTNPKAMIIIGRDRNADGSPALDADQIFDLEVIKRKYANMMDIMTYDDLLRRLDAIIASLRGRAAVMANPMPLTGPTP